MNFHELSLIGHEGYPASHKGTPRQGGTKYEMRDTKYEAISLAFPLSLCYLATGKATTRVTAGTRATA